MWLHVLFLLSLAINTQGTHARELSSEENRELETQLKIINKPALKTIKNEHGEIFDCVDIYKQPAFDNPLLKHHKLQVKPSFPIEDPTVELPLEGSLRYFGSKDGECPEGTVLIKRTTKLDLIRAKYVKDHLKQNHSLVQQNAPNDDPVPHVPHYALYSTYAGTYYGSRARLNVWNSKLESYQYSQTKIHLRSWANEDTRTDNFIEVGWMIFPLLFGDSETRLFTTWTADNAGKTGCYNMQCPGFVQVSRSITIGDILKPYSEFGKDQTEIEPEIYRDRVSHNWWLVHGPNNTPIGYFPKELFTSLSVSAKQVAWGGEVRTVSGHPFPPMGSGRPPLDLMGKATYIGQIQIVAEDNLLRNVKEDQVTPMVDVPQCYDTALAIEGHDHVPGGGFAFFFGGPGGDSCKV